MISIRPHSFFPKGFILNPNNVNSSLNQSMPYNSNDVSFCGSLFGSLKQNFIQINRMNHHCNEFTRIQRESKKIFELGLQFYEGKRYKKDYEKAFQYFLLAANKGNVEAQFSVGIFYYCGLGMNHPNKYKSFNYFKMAANKKHPKAQYCYAMCLAKGEGIRTNLPKAIRYFRLSAENGYDEGQYCYGRCLFNGFEIKQDFKQASILFKKSLDQGNPKAEFFYDLCSNPSVNANKYKSCYKIA